MPLLRRSGLGMGCKSHRKTSRKAALYLSFSVFFPRKITLQLSSDLCFFVFLHIFWIIWGINFVDQHFSVSFKKVIKLLFKNRFVCKTWFCFCHAPPCLELDHLLLRCQWANYWDGSFQTHKSMMLLLGLKRCPRSSVCNICHLVRNSYATMSHQPEIQI